MLEEGPHYLLILSREEVLKEGTVREIEKEV